MTTELFFTKPVSGAFTGSVLGDRPGAISFIGSASFAPQTDFAQDAAHAADADTADFATSAGTADSATTAGSADTAVSASHAVQADSASFAPTASAALTAVSASHALQADNAATAVSASHALQADNAATADFATSASHALQADNADTATSASHAVTADQFFGDVSASQVLPGTFPNGDFTFNGDITINGTASITHLQIVTTSVIFASGSTIFGDTLDDTHQFTGSVSVTGSVTADSFIGSGSGIVGVVSASHAVNADTASFAVDAETAATASFVTASNIQGTVESASFATTASFAEDATSASFATTASFAETASFVLNAETTSLAAKAQVAPMNISLNSFFGAEAKLRIPDDIVEQDDGQRTLTSLLGYTQARVIVRVTKFPSGSFSGSGPAWNAGTLAVEGSTDDASFAFLCGGSAGAGDGAPSASLSGTVDTAGTVVSPWCDITGTLAVEDVFLRWVTYSGSNGPGAHRPRVGSINLQVR